MIAAAALASLEGSGWSSTITRNSIFGHFRYLKSAKSWIVCKLNKAFFHFFSFAIFLTYCICLGRDFLFRILHSLYYNPDNHQISITKYFAKNEKNHEIQHVLTAISSLRNARTQVFRICILFTGSLVCT